jgi:hypothetical protein
MTIEILGHQDNNESTHFSFTFFDCFDFLTAKEAHKKGLCENCSWGYCIHPCRLKQTARGKVWEKLCTVQLRKSFPMKIEQDTFSKPYRKDVIYV